MSHLNIVLVIITSLRGIPGCRRLVFALFTFFLCLTASAQFPSNNNRFETSYVRGCVPFTLKLVETDTFPEETVRQYDFEGDGVFIGFEPGEEIRHVYNSPGRYRVVQVINVDIIPKTDTLEIDILPALLPVFDIFTCEGRAVKIRISPDQYDRYLVYFNPEDSVSIFNGEEVPAYIYPAGTHQVRVKGKLMDGSDNCPVASGTVSTINNLVPAVLEEVFLTRKDAAQGLIHLHYSLTENVIYQLERAVNIPAGFDFYEYLSGSTLRLDSLNTLDEVPIFRIAAYDACQEKYLYSDTLSALTINVEAENNQNRIAWDNLPVNFHSYVLSRDNSPLVSLSNSNIDYYLDNQVVCFESYCYSLFFENRQGHRSYSDTACVEAFSIYFPPAIRNTTVSVMAENYELKWIPPDNIGIREFFVQRQLEGDIYSTLDSLEFTEYTDTSFALKPVCYRISYVDQCYNRSNLGDPACSIFLSLSEDQQLTWTSYLGWRNGVKRYVLEIFDGEQQLQREEDSGKKLAYEIQDFNKEQINYYRIRAESNDVEPQIAYSNTIYKNISPVLKVPNTFTPNNDGLNDVFVPVGTLMKVFNMKIYNQFGNLIYESSDQLSGWDGTYNGTDLPSDTYIFDIIAEDFNGRKYNLKGACLILR